MKKTGNILLIAIFAGIILGGFCGWYFGEAMLSVKFLGDLFLNALKMVVVPLVICSMVMGMVNIGEVRKLGRTGVITLLYYLSTTGISVCIGIALVNMLKPGVGVAGGESIPAIVEGKHFSIIDVIVGMVPTNIFGAMVEMQILPLIVVSLFFGAILVTLGEKGKPLVSIFDAGNMVIMKMVHVIMIFSPIGIFGLVASKLGAVGGGPAFWLELTKLGKYAATVMIGLSIHAFIVLPLILIVMGKRNPLTYVYNLLSALATAFSTASSSATLPVTMECVEEKNGISNESAGFVLPLGATINMDGTALYEAVAAIFIAQVYAVPLEFHHQVIIFLTATLASIGAAGIPEAGLITMVLVLEAVGLPLEGIATILIIDWFLDRCRTTVNVWGDSVGAAVLERFRT